MKVALKSLIRVVEIWLPNKQGSGLHLSRAYYGQLSEFRQASMQLALAKGQGVAGKVMLKKEPHIFRELSKDVSSPRAALATKAGLDYALGVPIVEKNELKAVLTLFVEQGAIIETWTPNAVGKLGLSTGVYGGLSAFERASLDLSFSVLQGLPGRTFDARTPVLLNNLKDPATFVRSEAAVKAGLEMGLGIPCLENEAAQAVILMLMGKNPLWQAVEIWQPSSASLRLSAGYYGPHQAFEATSKAVKFKPLEGLPGQVYAHKMPVIFDNLASGTGFVRHKEAVNAGFQAAVGIPVIMGGAVKSVITLFI